MAGHAILDGSALDSDVVRGLSPTAFRVWVYVVRHARGRANGWCMSAASIAEQIGGSRSTTFRALAECEKAGVIKRQRTPGPNGGRGWSRYYCKPV